MATSIIGTFPILTSTKSETDEFGFDYVSYQYTIKTSTIGSYNIKKDDVFDGIETWRGLSWTKSPNPGSLYVVDSVVTQNVEGGLTELTVNTVGTKNIANPPRVSLLSNGPLIFGLSGTPPEGRVYGYGTAGAGQSVEVKFLAIGGAAGQQAVFTTHFSSAMPTTLGGASLPAPATGAGPFSDERVIDESSANPSLTGSGGQYYGFVCKTILTEKRGSLLLVTLIFSEAGYAFTWGGEDAEGNQKTVNVYYFPRVG
jgi:hypothetical protein